MYSAMGGFGANTLVYDAPIPQSYRSLVVREAPPTFAVEPLPPTKQGTWHYGCRIIPTKGYSAKQGNRLITEYEIWRQWDDCLDLQRIVEKEYSRLSSQKRKLLRGGASKSNLYPSDRAASFDSLPSASDPLSVSIDVHSHLPKLSKKSPIFRANTALVDQRGEQFNAFIASLFGSFDPLVEEVRAIRQVNEWFAWWKRDKDASWRKGLNSPAGNEDASKSTPSIHLSDGARPSPSLSPVPPPRYSPPAEKCPPLAPPMFHPSPQFTKSANLPTPTNFILRPPRMRLPPTPHRTPNSGNVPNIAEAINAFPMPPTPRDTTLPLTSRPRVHSVASPTQPIFPLDTENQSPPTPRTPRHGVSTPSLNPSYRNGRVFSPPGSPLPTGVENLPFSTSTSTPTTDAFRELKLKRASSPASSRLRSQSLHHQPSHSISSNFTHTSTSATAGDWTPSRPLSPEVFLSANRSVSPDPDRTVPATPVIAPLGSFPTPVPGRRRGNSASSVIAPQFEAPAREVLSRAQVRLSRPGNIVPLRRSFSAGSRHRQSVTSSILPTPDEEDQSAEDFFDSYFSNLHGSSTSDHSEIDPSFNSGSISSKRSSAADSVIDPAMYSGTLHVDSPDASSPILLHRESVHTSVSSPEQFPPRFQNRPAGQFHLPWTKSTSSITSAGSPLSPTAPSIPRQPSAPSFSQANGSAPLADLVAIKVVHLPSGCAVMFRASRTISLGELRDRISAKFEEVEGIQIDWTTGSVSLSYRPASGSGTTSVSWNSDSSVALTSSKPKSPGRPRSNSAASSASWTDHSKVVSIISADDWTRALGTSYEKMALRVITLSTPNPSSLEH